jgi:hypothetical protein
MGPQRGRKFLQAAEAEIDLLRIQKLSASRFNVLGNPETKLALGSQIPFLTKAAPGATEFRLIWLVSLCSDQGPRRCESL